MPELGYKIDYLTQFSSQGLICDYSMVLYISCHYSAVKEPEIFGRKKTHKLSTCYVQSPVIAGSLIIYVPHNSGFTHT